MFILDTEHIAEIQRQSQSAYGTLQSRMSLHPPTVFFVSVASFHEQALGAHTYVNCAAKTSEIVRGYELFWEILQIYRSMQMLPFDRLASSQFDAIRAAGGQIGVFDLRIAATARAHRFTVLTSNLRDFR